MDRTALHKKCDTTDFSRVENSICRLEEELNS